jgi:ABC-type transport system involved in multi-copper enzyme maturation permease subunit
MAAFPLTQFALQAVRPAQMIVQPVQVVPYFKHFFFFVVITQFAFAAFYFMVGALTRNNKIVYGLAACFYPLFIAYGLFLLRGLTVQGKNLLDPFLLNSGPGRNGFDNSADYLNQYIFSYTPEMICNRVLLILVAGVCLTWLYLRFTTSDQSRGKASLACASLGLPTATENASYDSESFPEAGREQNEKTGLGRRFKLKSPIRMAFTAIFWNEVRLNSKRVAPYFMALLCAGNGLLWWGWGPAAGRGLAINSDYVIAGVLAPYSFLTLPLFTALFMADPVTRDFRLGVDPLIFSKPIRRAEYLLGKFFGNFSVLACCQSAFVLTWFVLQAVPKKGVTTQNWKAFPYLKHFLVFVVISHLGLAAFYFGVGVLTRNPKIVYGLGFAFYPVYLVYQTVLLSSLPWRWKLALDPLVMNRGREIHSPAVAMLNQIVVVYDTDLIVNRVLMILIAAICLTIVYLRFTIAERSRNAEGLAVLNLSTATEGVYYPDSPLPPRLGEIEKPDTARAITPQVAVPEVGRTNEGIRAAINKLRAALGVEFRLLRAERSLVVIMPLTVFVSILEVAFYNIPPDVSHSAAYATNTAKLLLLFLVGVTVFYTGEAMHRDREVRIEPVIWTVPSPNFVLLVSKFLAVLSLTVSLVVLVGLTAILIQLFRGHTPIHVSAYLRVYSVVLLPSIVFTTGVSIALNILLREKYLAYALSIGTGVGLFYLYSQGYNHWLYNPFLYQLWTYADLTGGGSNQATILIQRIYFLAIAIGCLSFAHLFFERKSNKGFRVKGQLSGTGWSSLLSLVSLTVAITTGWIISSAP